MDSIKVDCTEMFEIKFLYCQAVDKQRAVNRLEWLMFCKGKFNVLLIREIDN